MNRLTLSAVLLLGLGLGLGRSAQGADGPGRDLFNPDKIWTAHLEISAKDWEAMHPTRGMRFFGAPAFAPPRDGGKPNPVPAPPRGGFGFDFDYVKANLEFDGKKIKDVGVRFKGNSSYSMTAQGLKRPFKIDFDRYTEKGNLQGLRMINLANNALDPSQLRESLAYSVFRAAGVPSPRTGFVELSLTVPGKHERVLLGVYTLIEQVDRRFLENHFKKGKGLLLKPEGIQNLPYLGQEWKPYQDMYRPKKEPTAAEKQRLIEFTRLVNFADDATFNTAIGQYLDVDRFLRYLAACSALVNIDSFVGFGHNYYLYLNPEDGRFVCLPWDLNGTFAGILLAGSVEQQISWSIKKPYLGNNRLTERVLAIPANDATYRKHLRALMEGGFKPQALHAETDRLRKTVQKAIEREVKSRKPEPTGVVGAMAALLTRPPDPKVFVTRRTEAVLAQLDGKAEGKDLGTGFGFQWGRANLANQLLKPLLTGADTDQNSTLTAEEASTALTKLFQAGDREKQGTMTEKALAEALTRLLPRPSGFGLLPGAPKPIGGGLGTHLAAFIFVRTGVKNDRLTQKELLTLGQALFQVADQNKDGSLDEKELTSALNSLPPAPAVFGPPRDAAPAKPANPKKP